MVKKSRKNTSKTKTKSKSKKRPARRSKPKSKLGRAYRVVTDTVAGTGKLRNKMERTGTDESE